MVGSATVKKARIKRLVLALAAFRRRILEIAAISAVITLLMYLTLGTEIGASASLLDYNLVWLVLAIATIAFWRTATRHRNHVATYLIYWGLLATVSGFVILYTKQWLKDTGYKDYAKFWHCAFSGLFTMYVLWHVANHWDAIKKFFAIHFRNFSAGLQYALFWGAIVVATLVSISMGESLINKDNYIPLCTWSIFLFVAAFLVFYKISEAQCARAGRQFDAEMKRITVINLIPIVAYIVVSGFAFLYFKDPFSSAGLKYVAKYWHTFPSIMFSVVAVTHTTYMLKRLWQRI